ncbi:MAG TPA: hypothetical protein DCG67_20180 [Pseudomonas sp.]|uniref:hypothetical protein n=1 Tax=Stutzerimonas balearica TaxID=74829 RepID=UPI000C58FD52|nr:hypothetical protein [Phycisphaerae bacterium]HAF94064.1 hypothetical protein [Pseudomonas sp.]|tara:strand:+ start:468 stop:971 length:504 start_codon:yes stop_codon:yes gene_type:complete
MNFTTIQIIALLGSLASLALLFGIGYHEGRRAARNDLAQASKAHEELIENLRHQRDRAVHEHTLSRLNAAQALEAITSELDEARRQIALLERQALTDADAHALAEITGQLNLAATTYQAMHSNQATHARRLAHAASTLAERYWTAAPRSTWERVDATLGSQSAAMSA